MPVLPGVFKNNIIKVFNGAGPKKQISVRRIPGRPQDKREILLQIMAFAAVTPAQSQELEAEPQDGTNRSRRRSQELCLHFLLLRWTSTLLLQHCEHPTLAQGGNCREQTQTCVENCQQISPFISLTWYSSD